MPRRRASRCAMCAATAWNILKKLEKDHMISEDEHRDKARGGPEDDRRDDPRNRCCAAPTRKARSCRSERHHGRRLESRDESIDRGHHRARPSGRFPRHVAIIMDGNGRWAAQAPAAAHRRAIGQGVEALRRTVRAASELGDRTISPSISFSVENWSRPRDGDQRSCFDLLRRFVRQDVAELHRGQCPHHRHRRARRPRGRYRRP